MKSYTHGKGVLYASVCLDLDFSMAFSCATDFVHRGSMIYSAFMPGNSNCSRFVESVLIAGLNPKSKQRKRLIVHETIVSSPISNVVNGSCNRHVYMAVDGKITSRPMTRMDSRSFFVSQTLANFRQDAARELPDDISPGFTHEPQRPETLPETAQWLGGIGEGAWFQLVVDSDMTKLVKFDVDGNVEFERMVVPSELDFKEPYCIDYDTHATKLTILQHHKRVSIPLQQRARHHLVFEDTPNKKNTAFIHELQHT
jgi:hypothetical protein